MRTVVPLGMWCSDGIGTPQTRWREIHHSERDRTNAVRRLRAREVSTASCGRSSLPRTRGREECHFIKGSKRVFFDVVQICEPLRCRSVKTTDGQHSPRFGSICVIETHVTMTGSFDFQSYGYLCLILSTANSAPQPSNIFTTALDPPFSTSRPISPSPPNSAGMTSVTHCENLPSPST